MGFCDHVSSYQSPKADTSRGPGDGSAYPLLKVLGRAWPKTRALPRVEEGGGTDR
jgi:hypothetical protein